ncbi:MAG: hypothetical protein IKN53_04535 [Oscillibacter sp.]|nr:hypothetical protein [Oscillibacter sp.]
MDKFPVYLGGEPVGELTARREGADTFFTLRARGRGLWSAWAVGERGEFRLGLADADADGILCLRRRFTAAMTERSGAIVRCELRAVSGEKAPWKRPPPSFFRSAALRRAAAGEGALCRTEGAVRYLALPFAPERPFPLPALFCFASLAAAEGTRCWIFAFDAEERPVFSGA